MGISADGYKTYTHSLSSLSLSLSVSLSLSLSLTQSILQVDSLEEEPFGPELELEVDPADRSVFGRPS